MHTALFFLMLPNTSACVQRSSSTMVLYLADCIVLGTHLHACDTSKHVLIELTSTYLCCGPLLTARV